MPSASTASSPMACQSRTEQPWEYTGVALFEDGRIATKKFVDVSDETADSGAFRGYSTYTFQNGDSLTLSYTGGWDANGAKGAYKVVSGTGAFSGATGTGEFKSV